MKFHDALVYELIRPTRYGEPTGEIIKLVGSRKIKYQLEETERFQERATHSLETLIDYMTPDIVVTRLRPSSDEAPKVVIEVETDVDFDFAKSLRQIKRYKRITQDVRLVIPKEYEKFAPLYANEGFRVWLWRATRKLECLRCRGITEVEGPYKLLCKKCQKYTKHRLVALENVEFLQFPT